MKTQNTNKEQLLKQVTISINNKGLVSSIVGRAKAGQIKEQFKQIKQFVGVTQ